MAPTTFNAWLKNLHDNDSDLKTLQELQPNSNKLDDYVAAIQIKAQPNDKDRLLLALARYFDRWSNNRSPAEIISEKYGTFLLIIFGFIIAGVLVYGLFKESFFNSIAGVEQARGLITFLFAFATISIILLVTVATFWMEKDEVNERFGKAKDLIAILIGVLGTIIGFYFGSGSSTTNPSRPLIIANVALSTYSAKAGDTITLSATFQNGSAPYRYEIKVNDPTGALKVDPKEKTSDASAISEAMQIPLDTKPTSATFTISARDAKGNQAYENSKPLSVQAKQ
jgi:hypothetical protein